MFDFALEAASPDGRQPRRIASKEEVVQPIDEDRNVGSRRQLLFLKNRRLANRVNLYLSLGIEFDSPSGPVTAAPLAATPPGSEER